MATTRKFFKRKFSTIPVAATPPPPSAQPFVTSGPLSSPRNGYSGVVGFGWTETSIRTISSLGRFIAPGNSQSHTITLQDATSGLTLATAVVDTNGQPAGTYVYVSITPQVTIIGRDYVVVSDETNGGDDFYDFSAVTIVPGPTIWGTTTNLSSFVNNQQAYVPTNFLWQ